MSTKKTKKPSEPVFPFEVTKSITDEMIESVEKQDEETKLKALIQEKQKAKVSKCEEEVRAILKKYNCGLDVAITITKTGNFPQIQIVPLPTKV